MRYKEGKTFKQISEYLDELGYKTIKSNKTIKPQYVYSIFTKGEIRQDRINRSFESHISNVELYWIRGQSRQNQSKLWIKESPSETKTVHLTTSALIYLLNLRLKTRN